MSNLSLLSFPRGIGTKLGMFASNPIVKAGFFFLDLYNAVQSGKNVFNLKDNLVTSLIDLGIAINNTINADDPSKLKLFIGESSDQKKVYQEQLEMANSLDLPAVVHCRKSDADVLSGIQQSGHESGVIHCFASSLDFAEKIMETGFYISFTGMITFVKELEEVVREVPLEKMMVETDSPYLAPKPYRGKQNEPAWVIHVAEKIAELKELSLEEVAESTTQTAYRLFDKLDNYS